MTNVIDAHVIDDLLVLFLSSAAEFDDSMHHATSAFWHIVTESVKITLQSADVALNVGRQ